MALDVTEAKQIKDVAENIIAKGELDVVFDYPGYGLAVLWKVRTKND